MVLRGPAESSVARGCSPREGVRVAARRLSRATAPEAVATVTRRDANATRALRYINGSMMEVPGLTVCRFTSTWPLSASLLHASAGMVPANSSEVTEMSEVLCDVRPCRVVHTDISDDTSLHLRSPLLEFVTLKRETVHVFETSVTIPQPTRCDIAEDLNIPPTVTSFPFLMNYKQHTIRSHTSPNYVKALRFTTT